MKKMVSLFGCLVILTIWLASPSLAEKGIINKALALDGDGDYVEVPDADSLDLSDGMTLEAWIRPLSTEGPRVIISKWNDVAGEWSYLFKVDNDSDKLRIELSKGGHSDLANLEGTTSIPVEEWSHVAATYDSSNVKLYFNGIEDGIQPAADSINNSIADLQIGTVLGWGGWEFFNGQIDEVRVWNVARTQGQIGRWMNRRIWWHPEGLVGYWRMDDPLRSRTAKDYSGNGNDGTLMGDAHFVLSPKAQAAPSTRSTNFPKIAMTWGHLKAKQ